MNALADFPVLPSDHLTISQPEWSRKDPYLRERMRVFTALTGVSVDSSMRPTSTDLLPVAHVSQHGPTGDFCYVIGDDERDLLRIFAPSASPRHWRAVQREIIRLAEQLGLA